MACIHINEDIFHHLDMTNYVANVAYYTEMSKAPSLFAIRDYRGATVEDLDIKPAISINPTTHLNEALEIAYENEFTYLPVIHESNKKLLGIFNVEDLKTSHDQNNRTRLAPLVKNHMLWFKQTSKANYEKEHQEPQKLNKTALNTTILKPQSKGKSFDVITPMTPLENLAKFFSDGVYFAIITNDEGTLVYGVATPEDLTRYENSRPRL